MATFSYLYTNDIRIATLQEKITWVAKAYVTDTVPNPSLEKSASNNFASIAYYFGLTRESNLTKAAAMGNADLVILNFIKKFQFPNPRTPDSLQNEISCGEKLAPLREIVKVLVQFHTLGLESYLTLEEIRLFLFYNAAIAKRENYNLIELCHQIIKYRADDTLPSTITIPITNDEFWKQEKRQVRELTNILKKVKCISEINGELHLDTKSLTYQLKGLLFDIVTFDAYWENTKGQNPTEHKQSYLKYLDITDEELDLFDKDLMNLTPSVVKQNARQVIYYGAPGTGKSFEVNEQTKGYSTVRTTFHPDTDYSTFVGAYKPVMKTEDVKVVPVVIGEGGVTFNKNEGSLKEQRIIYKFIRQAFLKAYQAAWKKYAEAGDTDAEPQFLVIEEINRGNCAQIFGDLFQLLDRESNGFSKYPIEADTDLTREINAALNEEEGGEYQIKEDYKINAEGAVDKYTSSTGHTLSEDIQEGRVLLLPPNLYIWATMNTSDQSLFPIDSAFKRRWTWKYTKIAEGYERDNNGEYKKGPEGKRIPLGWRIEGNDYTLDWWTFVQAINKAIGGEGSAEDKKLGYFFCKPDNGINISEETFVGKVMFYLWNDVFKDSDTVLFKVTDDDPTFDAFYTEDDNGFTVVNSTSVKQFLKNVLGDKDDKIVQKIAAPTDGSSDTDLADSEPVTDAE